MCGHPRMTPPHDVRERLKCPHDCPIPFRPGAPLALMRFTVSLLRFLASSIVVGLALAFLLVWLRPASLFPPADGVEAAVGNGPASYAEAVARAAPSVVSIYTQTVVSQRVSFSNPYYQRFFGDRLVQRPRQGLGSGVIVNPDGYILTNYHVVGQALDIQVQLYDGRVAEAQVVGVDPETDLAVLKVNLSDLPAAPLNSATALQVGDVVLAIGNALGLSHTVTLGIVSATGRSDLRISLYEDFIQTDAAVNSGNSGGALINAQGDVVGINTSTLSQNLGAQGIGFAIPVGLARHVMDQIIEYGAVRRGWIGATLANPPFSLNADGSTMRPAGVQVMEVLPDGPAWQAGLRAGDFILNMAGEPVTGARELLLDVSRRTPGESVEIEASRDGQAFTTSVQLIQQPPLRRS